MPPAISDALFCARSLAMGRGYAVEELGPVRWSSVDGVGFRAYPPGTGDKSDDQVYVWFTYGDSVLRMHATTAPEAQALATAIKARCKDQSQSGRPNKRLQLAGAERPELRSVLSAAGGQRTVEFGRRGPVARS